LGRKRIEFNEKYRHLTENENNVPAENLAIDFFLPKKTDPGNGKRDGFK
jgi:hypothetical protein